MIFLISIKVKRFWQPLLYNADLKVPAFLTYSGFKILQLRL